MDDVAAIDVGIGHNHYPLVAQAFHTELFFDADAQGFDKIENFLVGQHLIQPGPFYV